jgi:hypothetical protein
MLPGRPRKKPRVDSRSTYWIERRKYNEILSSGKETQQKEKKEHNLWNVKINNSNRSNLSKNHVVELRMYFKKVRFIVYYNIKYNNIDPSCLYDKSFWNAVAVEGGLHESYGTDIHIEFEHFKQEREKKVKRFYNHISTITGDEKLRQLNYEWFWMMTTGIVNNEAAFKNFVLCFDIESFKKYYVIDNAS